MVARREEAPLSARSAVAITHDAVWVVVAVGAPSIASEDPLQLGDTYGNGMPLWVFAEWLVAQGAVSAINLDGGISSAMLVRAGEERFEILGAAGTINAVVLRP